MNLFERLESSVVFPNESEMRHFAGEFVKTLAPDSTLALSGPMGAGKTTFTRGLGEGLGVKGAIKSPSFNYYLTYRGTTHQLLHLDAYRIQSVEQYDSLLIEEVLERPWLLVVEWPENILSSLSEKAIWLQFTDSGPEQRTVRLLRNPLALNPPRFKPQEPHHP